ncbi:U3 snoRNP protein [Coelomomyces lativittatus]|nr:U3 snoRNP protein [Coelomomyces lativittatus]
MVGIKQLNKNGGSNRWKFQSFSERIKNIQINITANDSQALPENENDEPNFLMGLRRFKDLNLTDEYVEFSKEIYPFCGSLSLMIYHKEKVISIISRHLESLGSLAAEPILKLIPMLAKDLRQELEDSFPTLIETLISFCHSKEPDIVELAFQGIVYLMKYLQKYVLREFKYVYVTLSPLLGNGQKQKPYVRQFISEALAYIIRKISSEHLSTHLKTILTSLIDENDQRWADYADGISSIFANAVNHITYTLHSSTPYFLRTLLECVLTSPSSIRVDEAMKQTVHKIIRHVEKEKSQVLFTCLLEFFPFNPDRVSLFLLPTITFYNGSKIYARSEILNCMSTCDTTSLSTDGLTALALLLTQSSEEEILHHFTFIERLHLKPMFLTPDNFFAFHKKLITSELSFYQSIFLPLAIKYLEANFSSILDRKLLAFLSEILPSKYSTFYMSPPMFKSEDSFLRFLVNPCKAFFQNYGSDSENEIVAVALLTIFSSLHLPTETAYLSLSTFLKKIQNHPFLFGMTLKTLINYVPDSIDYEVIHGMLINLKFSSCPYFLEAVSLFSARFTSISVSQKLELFQQLLPFSGSFSHAARQPVFSAFTHLFPNSVAFQLCFDLEKTENTLEEIRRKGLLLKRLIFALEKEEDHVRKISCSYICSLYSINFSTLWRYVHESLDTFASLYPTLFWDEVYTRILSLQSPDLNDSSPNSIFSHNLDVECADNNEKTALRKISLLLHQTYSLPSERIDYWNIHSMLLHVLVGKEVVEKKTKQLVPLFLEFLTLDYHSLHPEVRFPNLPEALNATSLSLETIQTRNKRFPIGPTIVERNLCHYLEMFSHLRPSNTYLSECLFLFFIELLCSNDFKIQRLTLNCINNYAYSWFSPYFDFFSQMLNEFAFKDAILSINVSPSGLLTFDPQHRKEIMPLFLRLLYGQLRSRQKKYSSSKRNKVFVLLSSCNQEEIFFFFNLLSPVKYIPETIDLNIFKNLSSQRAFQFCKLSEDLTKHLQLKMQYILDPILTLLTSLVCSISHILEQVKTDNDIYLNHEGNGSERYAINQSLEDDISLQEELKEMDKIIERDPGSLASSSLPPYLVQRMKKIRTQAFHRLIELFNMELEIPDPKYMIALYAHVVVPRLPRMVQENIMHPTPIMDLLSSLFLKRDLALQPQLHPLIDVLISCLSGSSRVRNVVLDILFKVLEQRYETLIPFTSSLFHQFLKMIRHSSASMGLRIFELIKQLSPHLQSNDASLMANVTLETLNSKLSPSIKNAVLEILRPCIKYLETEHIKTIFFATTRLFAVLEKQESRLKLVMLTKELCSYLSLSHTGELCQNLNQPSNKRLDELDYDSVLNAFSIVLDQEVKYSYLEWVPLLYNFLFYLKSPDLSIRNSAFRCITLFIQLASTQDHFHSGIHQIIFPAIKLFLKNNKNDVARAEYVKVLHQCIFHLKEEPFINLQVLLAKDASDESGFLDNIYHIQIHRRIRAVMRLRNNIDSISINNLKNIIFPILLNFLNHSDSNLVKECLLNFTEIASKLSWKMYYNFLQDFFARLSRSKSKAEIKLSIRAILAWLNGFHFKLTQFKTKVNLNSSNNSSKNRFLASGKKKDKLKVNSLLKPRVISLSTKKKTKQQLDSTKIIRNKKLKNLLQVKVKSVNAGLAKKATVSNSKEKIIQVVTGQIIPRLMKYFIALRNQEDPSSKSLRIPVALGVAQLVSRLPSTYQQDQITKLLTRLCQLLRSRSKVMRYKTRATIIQIMKIVGSDYLHYLIKELKTALQRGYELHVLAYTVHKVMKYMQLRSANLEKCTHDLCSIVYNDIFGQVGQEKDAEAYIKTMVELKTCKSYDIIRMMANRGSKKVISALIETMKKIFMSNPDAHIVQKTTKALKDISTGLSSNSLITLEALVKISFSMIQKNDDVEQNADSAASWKKYSHYLVDFGLQLLLECLNSKKLRLDNGPQMKLIDSMLWVLPPIFSSTYQPSIISAGRVLEKLIRLRLPNLINVVPDILKPTFLLLSKIHDYRSDISQILLRVILATLKHCDKVPFNQSQIRCILEIVKPELGNDHHQTVYFSIIQSILKRKLLFHEVYDIAFEISQIMITSYSKNAQQLCRATYLEFLLDYPQTEKRLDDHFAWMIKNLDYENEKGRLSLLEFLQVLIKKLPESVLNKYGQMLITGLICKLMDDSPKCKELSATILKNLLTNFSSIQKIHSMVRVWYQTRETMAIAAQVHGILISINKDDVSLLNQLLAMLPSISVSDTASATTELVNDQATCAIEQWQTLYFAIKTLTKYVEKQQATPSINVPQILSTYFLHPHHWIRLASSKCLGAYLTHLSQMDVDLTAHTITAMIKQLKSPNLDEALSKQVVKNIYQLFLQHQNHLSIPSIASSSPNLIMRPVKHLSYLARRDQSINKGTLFRSSILKIFAAIIHGFPNEYLLPISVPILAPIYRTVEDETTKGTEWSMFFFFFLL